MNINELKDIIKEKFTVSEWKDHLLECDIDFNEKTNLEYNDVTSGRIGYDGDYHWVFEIDGVTYRLDGFYDSWSGFQLDEPFDFYEVKPVTKTITTYERI